MSLLSLVSEESCSSWRPQVLTLPLAGVLSWLRAAPDWCFWVQTGTWAGGGAACVPGGPRRTGQRELWSLHVCVLLLSLSPGLRLALLGTCCAQTSQHCPTHLHSWPTASSACWSQQPSPGCESPNSAPQPAIPCSRSAPHQQGSCSGVPGARTTLRPLQRGPQEKM